jgi:transketolase C-terminal domain/subunit
VIRQSPDDRAVIVSSGRGVHEALAAAEACFGVGVGVSVVDMPSVDERLLMEVCDSGKLILFAEQNNGYIWQNFLKVQYRRAGRQTGAGRIVTVNTLNAEGRPQFIHSATYEELIEVFGLSALKLAAKVQELLAETQ